MKPEEAPLFSNMDDQGDTEIISQAGDTDEKAEEIIVSTKSPEHALLKKISKDNTEEDQMMTEIRKVEKIDNLRMNSLTDSLIERLTSTTLMY